MTILAPVEPFVKTKLEALSAGVTYFLLLGLIPTAILFTTYVLFYTRYWFVAVIYLFWIWVIDRHTPDQKGRISTWVQSWVLFKYTSNHFPINLHPDPGIDLDAKRNYMACCFPHGVMPTGVIMAFQTTALNAKAISPFHTIYGVALNGLFHVPIYRDFLLSIGLINANAKTIENRLSDTNGGNIVGIIIGGAAEMFCHQSGHYRIVLKDRKGFIKVALKTGSPLIPLFSFGENSIYKQKTFPKGSFPRRLQEWSKIIIGYPIVLFYGQGVFQKFFGFVPLKSPINVVVGTPIDVEKINNPTEADIESLHKKFVEKLTALFEEHKYHYEPNPEKCKLIVS